MWLISAVQWCIKDYDNTHHTQAHTSPQAIKNLHDLTYIFSVDRSRSELKEIIYTDSTLNIWAFFNLLHNILIAQDSKSQV